MALKQTTEDQIQRIHNGYDLLSHQSEHLLSFPFSPQDPNFWETLHNLTIQFIVDAFLIVSMLLRVCYYYLHCH